MSEGEVRAATIIQARFRVYQARKLYLQKHPLLFEEDEERRREKERAQVLEGEILLEQCQHCHKIVDNKTLNLNEDRLMNVMAIRIQQAWKKYKRNTKHPSQQQLNNILNVHDDTCIAINADECRERASVAHGIQTFDTSNNERTEILTHQEQEPHCNKSGDNLSTSSISIVEQLVSRVNSVLSQDDLTELEMFETPEYAHFEGQANTISCQSKTSSVNPTDNVSPTSSGHTFTQTVRFSKAELDVPSESRPNTITVEHGETEEVLQCGKKKYALSNINTLGSHDAYSTHTAQDSMLDDALKISTGQDHKEGVMSPEERYRLCYTIELSDSSSEEDKNNGALQEPGGINFPDTMSAKLEAGTILNGHYHQEFEDFVSEDDLTLQHVTPQHNQRVHDEQDSSHQCELLLDHSSSPLFTMSLQQLRQLFLSLERQLSDHSTTLIQLLQERDALNNENKLLKANISRMARSVQSLYVPH